MENTIEVFEGIMAAILEGGISKTIPGGVPQMDPWDGTSE